MNVSKVDKDLSEGMSIHCSRNRKEVEESFTKFSQQFID